MYIFPKKPLRILVIVLFFPNFSGRFFAVLVFMLDLIFFSEWDPFGCKLDSLFFCRGGGYTYYKNESSDNTFSQPEKLNVAAIAQWHLNFKQKKNSTVP